LDEIYYNRALALFYLDKIKKNSDDISCMGDIEHALDEGFSTFEIYVLESLCYHFLENDEKQKELEEEAKKLDENYKVLYDLLLDGKN
jgi:hypothetical protein